MEIRPFCGMRYNENIVGGLASVICPPYDVVTPGIKEFYYRMNDYNTIRLECHLADSLQPTKYSYKRTAVLFQEWLNKGVLKFDDTPAFYLHDHYFNYLGVKRRRRGLIARLKLASWGDGIYPHEETSTKDKSDRLQLIRACRANFSPLFCLYQDVKGEIASILSEAAQDNPIMSLRAKQSNPGDCDERHVVWAITDLEMQQELSALSRQVASIIMADGHHRYETALAYQQERARLSPGSRPLPNSHDAKARSFQDEAFNYVMATLVELSDPGLFILPIYRLVRSIKPLSSPTPSMVLVERTGPRTSSPKAGISGHHNEDTFSYLMSRLEDFFTLEFMPLTHGALHSLLPGLKGHLFGVLGLKPGHLALLKERQGVSLEDMMPLNHSQAYQKFDISILNHVILDKILGLTADEENVAYTVDAAEACQRVEKGEYQLAFLVNPPQPETIKAMVDAGDRMPRKSTYFCPKMPAGLVINSLD